MSATLYLFACALATTQVPAADPADWQGPRLSRGQELVYRGEYAEEARGQGVLFNRSHRLETRIFVLDVPPQGADVACFSVWKGRASRTEGGATSDTSSARLELARVDGQGRLTPATNTQALTVPLDGPPIIECGAFVEVPRGRMRPDQSWEVAEAGRPTRVWQVSGIDTINGARCIKLVGLQQSDDWDRPRADRTAWRRQDTVWLAQRVGIAYKVERSIERREPARSEPTQKLVLKYELESSLQYPGQLYDDRRREIMQTQTFAEAVTALMPKAGQVGPRPFEAVIKRIEYHNDKFPPTPYRDAVRHVQRLAEAGKRGEVPPETSNPEAAPVANVVGLNKQAPDFMVKDWATKESVRMSRWAGKPIVLVFYSPTAASAPEVLRFAQKLSDTYGHQSAVLGLALTDDGEKVLKQRDELGLKIPLLSGTGLRLSYLVESTPKLMVIDAGGLMRGSYVGWGPEIPVNVTEDLKKCLTPIR